MGIETIAAIASLISLAIGWAGRAYVAYVKAEAAQNKVALSEAQRSHLALLSELAEIAVLSAEEEYSEPGSGGERFPFAVKALIDLAEARGITIPGAEIHDLIRAVLAPNGLGSAAKNSNSGKTLRVSAVD